MKKPLSHLGAGVRKAGLPAPEDYERREAFLNSSGVRERKPWPLQALAQLQAAFASVPALPPLPVFAQPVMNSAAAEAAPAKPKIFLPSMARSPCNVIADLPGYDRRCLP